MKVFEQTWISQEIPRIKSLFFSPAVSLEEACFQKILSVHAVPFHVKTIPSFSPRKKKSASKNKVKVPN